MNKITILSGITAGLILVVSFGIIALHHANAQEPISIWTTDADGNPVYDFAPESIVYIHGSGFTPGNTVQINITRPDGVIQTAPGSEENYYRFPEYLPTVQQDGTFSYHYDLNGIYGLYTIDVNDGVVTATTTFKDGGIAVDSVISSDSTGTEKNNFSASEDVYAKLTTHIIGGGTIVPQTVRIYVINTPLPANGASLSDVGDGYDIKILTSGDRTGPYLVWTHTLSAGNYILYVGTDNNSHVNLNNDKWYYFNVSGTTTTTTYSLTVNTNPVDIDSTTGSGTYAASAVVSISAPQDVGTAGSRYHFDHWSSNNSGTFGSTTAYSTTFTMPAGTVTVTANYVQQYELTMAANFGTTTPSIGGHWYNAGVTVTINATAPSVGPSERYVWNGWTGVGTGHYTGTANPATDLVTMNGPITETANWTHQYLLTFQQTGLDNTATGTIVNYTIDDGGAETLEFDDFPETMWVDNGSNVTYLFTNPVPGGSGKQFRLDSVDGPVSWFIVAHNETITGNYIVQYLVTFKQSGLGNDAIGTVVTIDVNNDSTNDYLKDYAGLGTTGFKFWVDNGTYINYSYTNPITSSLPNTQYWLQSITGPASVFEVIKPETIIGNYMKLPYSAVTTSSLCPFDKNNNIAGQQFNLLFTKDITDLSKYRLTASNPGQFYYNTFYIGIPGNTVDIQLIIPSPFVTQGAVPIHVYSGVNVSLSGCFLPYDEIGHMALDFGTGNIITIEDVTVPESRLVYVTIHLDFGWKKQTGYNPGTNNLADNTNNLYDITNLNSYTFYYKINGALQPESPTIQNINIFKNDPGFFGIVTVDGEPVSYATITIKDSAGNILGTTTTDENGYYFFFYKHTGKETRYTVSLTSTMTGTHSSIVTLKSNKFVWVPFEL